MILAIDEINAASLNALLSVEMIDGGARNLLNLGYISILYTIYHSSAEST